MPIFKLPRSTRPAMPADVHRHVEIFERHFDLLEEMNARICHFDSGMTPIEKIDAQKAFECSSRAC